MHGYKWQGQVLGCVECENYKSPDFHPRGTFIYSQRISAHRFYKKALSHYFLSMSDIEITPDVSNRGATVTLPPDPLARSHPYQIQVVYTDDARSKPNDTLREINELSTNINDGYGGK